MWTIQLKKRHRIPFLVRNTLVKFERLPRIEYFPRSTFGADLKYPVLPKMAFSEAFVDHTNKRGLPEWYQCMVSVLTIFTRVQNLHFRSSMHFKIIFLEPERGDQRAMDLVCIGKALRFR